ncbi:DUF3748 domain-containing protein [Fimbriiglobus ruber]|uniref:Uncharacterized protein YidR n=1 Tax=Fimbriiglobus ruber TaxID=1908690 RepID=A0A225E097_9BACT|nr:DUF3748 domain-containing protein [Fimbriiglobus ruber]OWK46972.1 Uncharacterized protein YidR [Fimbriiglobus ruber]
MPFEQQLTSGPSGRILTNYGVWSPDGAWIAYDTRSDPAGDVFDGPRIEMVNVHTREVRVLYEARNGASCGVVTWHPTEPKVCFILGPENPTPDWQYGPSRRQGVIVDVRQPGVAVPLDARDMSPPFTAGALRGGSHVHVWSPDGALVSFTYEDQVLSLFTEETDDCDVNQRNVGMAALGRPVDVPRSHPRNHDGTAFSVLVTRTTARPRAGADEISRAFEEAWVGLDGFVRANGVRQHRALAFQGHVRAASGETLSEVFIADLPADLTCRGDGPLEGTATRRPAPPAGTTQRRLTFTESHAFPGIQGPRHWLRSSPDGARIGFLKKDDAGIVQFWTISPNGGQPIQVTRNTFGVASAFTWHPDGQHVAFVIDGSVCIADATEGRMTRLTPKDSTAPAPRSQACVFSPDGKQIAFVRRVSVANQICLVAVEV